MRTICWYKHEESFKTNRPWKFTVDQDSYLVTGDVFEDHVSLWRVKAGAEFAMQWMEGINHVCVKRLGWIVNLFAWPTESLVVIWGASLENRGSGMFSMAALFMDPGTHMEGRLKFFARTQPPWINDFTAAMATDLAVPETTAYDLIGDGL